MIKIIQAMTEGECFQGARACMFDAGKPSGDVKKAQQGWEARGLIGTERERLRPVPTGFFFF